MQRIFKVRIKAIELGLLSVWWAWSTSRPIKLCLFSQWCNQHLIVKIFSWIKYVILGKHIICDPMDWSPPGSSVHSFLQGIFLIQGIKPRSPALQADSLLSEPRGKPKIYMYMLKLQVFISLSEIVIITSVHVQVKRATRTK